MTEGEVSALLDEGLVSTYLAEADALKFEVMRLAEYGSPHFLHLAQVYATPMKSITKFRMKPFAGGAFAFDSETGVFTINLDPLLALFGEVLDDIRSTDAAGGHVLDRDEIHPLLRRVFRLYLLHELRHLGQGLADHASVQALKKIAGEGYLAELDLYADRDAAAAYAALQVYGNSGGRAAYLEHFREALFYSGQYSFRVFRFTMERPPKMARAVGLALMAARLARVDLQDADLSNIEDASPLDAVISVKLTRDYDSLAVTINDPDARLIDICCDVPDGKLRELAFRVDRGDFLGALDIASVLLNRMSLAV